MKIKPISIIKIVLRLASRLLLQHQRSPEDFKKNCPANNILIVSLTHLGDMVLLSPFLYNLRRNFPDAQIDILLKEQVSELIEYCPYINNRIIYNAKWIMPKYKKGDGLLKTLNIIRRLKMNHYDLSFVTHTHIFSNLIAYLAKIPFRVGYNDERDAFLNICVKKEKNIQHAYNYPLNLLRFLDLKVESQELQVYLGQHDSNFAETFCKNIPLSEASFLVGIHPGAGNREKIWMPDRYAKVIQYLLEKYNTHILLFADKREADITKKIKLFIKGYGEKISDLTGKTTLHQMVSLMKLCKIVLANDSGPMHIASALDKPIVALFAGTPQYKAMWRPLSQNCRVIFADSEIGGGLQDIKIEDVTEALDKLICSI